VAILERPRPVRRKRPLSYRRILVPVVDREVSEQAVALACRLAAERGARVMAVSVIEVPVELPLGSHMVEEEAKAKRLLAEAAAIGDLHGVTVEQEILRGRAAGDAIVTEAAEARTEIIVLSAPRKQRLLNRRFPFGSTVEYVLRHAPCRVMVAAAPASI
jgi:nucleotide-binding universal stress UspA family protein